MQWPNSTAHPLLPIGGRLPLRATSSHRSLHARRAGRIMIERGGDPGNLLPRFPRGSRNYASSTVFFPQLHEIIIHQLYPDSSIFADFLS
jgi:hypothetical protein